MSGKTGPCGSDISSNPEYPVDESFGCRLWFGSWLLDKIGLVLALCTFCFVKAGSLSWIAFFASRPILPSKYQSFHETPSTNFSAKGHLLRTV